jgi:hypothetical protein
VTRSSQPSIQLPGGRPPPSRRRATRLSPDLLPQQGGSSAGRPLTGPTASESGACAYVLRSAHRMPGARPTDVRRRWSHPCRLQLRPAPDDELACAHPTLQAVLRLGCDSSKRRVATTRASAETPANVVALVATNPARNEWDLQVRPGLAVHPEPVETVGIEPTSATAQRTTSTSVAGALYLAPHSPTPAGLWGASLKRCPPIR